MVQKQAVGVTAAGTGRERMPKLVVMLRVKDGGRFIDHWLANIGPLADEIVAVDNGSTDGTLERLRAHPKVAAIDRTVGFDEGRDKNLLYRRARERGAEWLLWIDVDETFESGVTREKLDRLMTTTRLSRIFFRRFHFIDETHFNVAPYWLRATSSYDRILWRDQASGYFENEMFNNGLVRGIEGPSGICRFRMRHTGYVSSQEVDRKIALYRTLDSSLEETYRKMRFENAFPVRWHERADAPIRTYAVDLLLDGLFLWHRAGRKIRHLLRLA